MSNVTVSVPPELKKRMENFEEMNWSAVARRAFEERLRDMETFEKIVSKSKLTEKDALELGRKINQAVWERHYKKMV